MTADETGARSGQDARGLGAREQAAEDALGQVLPVTARRSRLAFYIGRAIVLGLFDIAAAIRELKEAVRDGS